MSSVRPLKALRPRPEIAHRVAAVPYDVVDTEEARRAAGGEPLSFLHVSRPEIDLAPGTDPSAPEVHRQGRRALARLVDEGALVRDEEPALYLYRQAEGGHRQVGVMGAFSVAEYDAGAIRVHERTRPDKEDDRTRHLLALGAQDEPVFLTYRATAAIDRRVAEVVETEPPLYDLVADDGIGHTVWRLADAAPLVAAFAGLDALYVADGHHRSAAASRARAALREERGDGPWDRFLATAVPHDQVRILPYNRVVRDLAGLSPEGLLDRLRDVVEVSDDDEPHPGERGRFAMYLDRRWVHLVAPRDWVESHDPVESLDAAILQRLVLAPVLGIDDPRTSDRLDFVGGVRGTGELMRRVDAGEAAAAFSLHPLTVDDLMAVADAGRILPPKSTWFEPKLRSGLVVHEL